MQLPLTIGARVRDRSEPPTCGHSGDAFGSARYDVYRQGARALEGGNGHSTGGR